MKGKEEGEKKRVGDESLSRKYTFCLPLLNFPTLDFPTLVSLTLVHRVLPALFFLASSFVYRTYSRSGRSFHGSTTDMSDPSSTIAGSSPVTPIPNGISSNLAQAGPSTPPRAQNGDIQMNGETDRGTNGEPSADVSQVFTAKRDEEQARRDRSLAEFLVMLDGYKPVVSGSKALQKSLSAHQLKWSRRYPKK